MQVPNMCKKLQTPGSRFVHRTEVGESFVAEGTHQHWEWLFAMTEFDREATLRGPDRPLRWLLPRLASSFSVALIPPRPHHMPSEPTAPFNLNYLGCARPPLRRPDSRRNAQ